MKKQYGLTTKIFFGLIAGLITGLILYQFNEIPFVKNIIIGFFFELVGDAFINSIRMMIVPLVFVSLTVGAASIGSIAKLGRIGTKTVAFYLVTTAIAIGIAILIATIVQPGIGADIPLGEAAYEARQSPPFVDVLVNMIPRNPIKAMAEGRMLQIIVFAILTGTGLTVLGEKAKKVTELFEQLNTLVLKLVELIMYIAPFGVFALIAKTFSLLGFEAMRPLAWYMICVLGALLIHAIFTYGTLLTLFTKLNPLKFLKNFSPAMLVAFSTASSSATLPVTLKTARERLGVSESLSSFTLPLGATVNMDGTAIMQGVATVFIAQLFGTQLGIPDFLTIILTATLASIGTAGVPGVGLIMLAMVLDQVGLPVEAIGLILGIDRILDMSRTAINITGDAVCTLIIAKSEGELNEEVFNSDKAVTAEQ
ncbi:MAG: dicarboxylate/amino acid:cation symporter [Clostridiales bacterium]|nr:dicarboxylate/amino acid:cation symporter [Clostridiales bacterium]